MVADRLPETDAELGQVLRTLRGPRSLKDIQRSIQSDASADLRLSDTSLSRYENGDHIPVRFAGLLDRHYAPYAAGWLREAIVRLNLGTWEPWRDESPKDRHVHSWPMQYEGSVWIWVRPNPHEIGGRHTVKLEWGAWQQDVEVSPQDDGIALATDKAPDARPVTIAARVTPLAHVLFGIDEKRLNCPVLDIRGGWYPR